MKGRLGSGMRGWVPMLGCKAEVSSAEMSRHKKKRVGPFGRGWKRACAAMANILSQLPS